jgi:hypothetical protein
MCSTRVEIPYTGNYRDAHGHLRPRGIGDLRKVEGYVFVFEVCAFPCV